MKTEMENLILFFDMYPWVMVLIVIISIWDALWRMIAMWFAARNNHKTWFVCIALISSIGIVPMWYLAKYKPHRAGN